MSTPFPLVKIRPEFELLLGAPEEGTRIYRKDGSQEESAAWFDLLTEIIGPSVSPGGVGMYCPASRAAVYKRIKEGRLSIFLFHVTSRKTTLFGKSKVLRDSPYGYVPVSEAKAWRKELEDRAVRLGIITDEELEGAKPDWHGEFLQWKNKRERGNAEDHSLSLPELGKILVGTFMGKRTIMPAPRKKITQKPRPNVLDL